MVESVQLACLFNSLIMHVMHDIDKAESRRCPKSTHRAWLVGVAQDSLSKIGEGQAVSYILRGNPADFRIS